MGRYIGVIVAAVVALGVGYLIGAANVSPGDLTFLDSVGKAMGNGVTKLITILVVTVPIGLAVAGALRFRAVRLWLAPAYEVVLVAIACARQLEVFFRKGGKLSQLPGPAAQATGLSVLGGSIFAAAVVSAFIGLIGLLA